MRLVRQIFDNTKNSRHKKEGARTTFRFERLNMFNLEVFLCERATLERVKIIQTGQIVLNSPI